MRETRAKTVMPVKCRFWNGGLTRGTLARSTGRMGDVDEVVSASTHEITHLLQAWDPGDASALKPLPQFLRIRHFVRNLRLANLCLRAYNALDERSRRDEKRAYNLRRGQAADVAKRERSLSFRGQSGMAAGEDQTQAI